MSSIASLVKRIDSMLAVIEDQQRAAEQQQRVVIRLPIKDNEPRIEYQRGPVYFYIPENKTA